MTSSLSRVFLTKAEEQKAAERHEKHLASLAVQRRIHGVPETYPGAYIFVKPETNLATGKALPSFVVLAENKSAEKIMAEITDGLGQPEETANNLVSNMAFQSAAGNIYSHAVTFGRNGSMLEDVTRVVGEMMTQAAEQNAFIAKPQADVPFKQKVA